VDKEASNARDGWSLGPPSVVWEEPPSGAIQERGVTRVDLRAGYSGVHCWV